MLGSDSAGLGRIGTRVEAVRFAHQLIHEGKLGAALQLIMEALDRWGERADLLALLAWLKAESGDSAGAAEALLRLRPIAALSPEQELLVGNHLLSIGDDDTAKDHFVAALAKSGKSLAVGVTTANAFSDMGLWRESIRAAYPFLENEAADARVWRIVVRSLLALDRITFLEALVRRWRRRGRGGVALSLAARSLLDERRPEIALTLLDVADGNADGELLLLRSIALSQVGRVEEALQPARDAVVATPAEPAARRHLVAVLARLSQYREAAVNLDHLFEASDRSHSPDDEEWLRGVFAIYIEAGRYARAIEIGARIIAIAPGDDGFLGVYQTVIDRHLHAYSRSADDAESAVLLSRPNLVEKNIKAVSIGRNLYALFRREMKTRFGRSRVGYLWVLFEPLAHIGIMIFLIGMLNHGGLPPIGNSFAVFYFTGIIPYHMFTHTASHLIGAISENRPLLQIPRVRSLDIFAARALLEGVTELVVASIIFAAFTASGIEAIPKDPLMVFGGLILLWVAALGVGVASAAIVSVFPGWERVWGAMASIIYFTSGTFYIPRSMPVWIRDVLSWNPVLQGIELVRYHYFNEPRPEWLSVPYLTGFAVVSLSLSLLLESVMRRRMLDVE